jgi:hypothetical protein
LRRFCIVDNSSGVFELSLICFFITPFAGVEYGITGISQNIFKSTGCSRYAILDFVDI